MNRSRARSDALCCELPAETSKVTLTDPVIGKLLETMLLRAGLLKDTKLETLVCALRVRVNKREVPTPETTRPMTQLDESQDVEEDEVKLSLDRTVESEGVQEKESTVTEEAPVVAKLDKVTELIASVKLP